MIFERQKCLRMTSQGIVEKRNCSARLQRYVRKQQRIQVDLAVIGEKCEEKKRTNDDSLLLGPLLLTLIKRKSPSTPINDQFL